jgi:hypothetical protein
MIGAYLFSIVASSSWILDEDIRSKLDRIGRISIQGNFHTKSSRILDRLGFRSGQLLPKKDELLEAELRLLLEFHKRFELKKGLRPTIRVFPREADSCFRDIEISFPEKNKRSPDTIAWPAIPVMN